MDETKESPKKARNGEPTLVEKLRITEQAKKRRTEITYDKDPDVQNVRLMEKHARVHGVRTEELDQINRDGFSTIKSSSHTKEDKQNLEIGATDLEVNDYVDSIREQSRSAQAHRFVEEPVDLVDTPDDAYEQIEAIELE